ncbi:LPXTG cell wall anchor domain-containing protein [Micromonospora mangrovi]|uniref:LPXTG cell wall anchor domain-containing protein n=2 Tax=Micromonospora TaxID=1873 RepID=A0AAU8HCM8_9ACTN
MLTHSTRRWLAGLGVAGAFVAASATPALAGTPGVALGLYLSDSTIAAGSEGLIDSPILYASEPVVLHNATVRYDYRDLTGKVTLTSDVGSGDCDSPEAGVLVCQDPFEIGVDELGIGGLFNVAIVPTAEAKDGDVGDLKVTFSAEGATSASQTAKVKIGEGVDLAGGPEVNLTAAPGDAFSAPLVLANVGQTTAKGAAVFFDHDYSIRPGKHYSNCNYEGDRLISCQFTDTVAPGETFTASVPYVLGKDTYAPGNEHGYHDWMTPSEFDDFTAYLKHVGYPTGKPGTDGALTLTKKSSLKANSFQADTDPTNNWSGMEIKVTGKNGVDLAAVGDSVTGKAGEIARATVGVHNNGPAALDLGRIGDPVTKIDVTVPTGTTAVKVSDACLPAIKDGYDWEHPGKPGAKAYRCYPDIFIGVGESQTVEFGLRIDKVIPNATGAVVINAKCECSGFDADTNPANDKAKLVVNAAAGNGGGSGGEGGGDGGTLPITGSSTGLIAGIGVLLLAAGFGGYVVARRRRTRFVA